jgi:hypothetical protein
MTWQPISTAPDKLFFVAFLPEFSGRNGLVCGSH